MLKQINKLWEKAYTAKSAVKFLEKHAEELNSLECCKTAMQMQILPTPKVDLICLMLKMEIERLKALPVELKPEKPQKEKFVREKPKYQVEVTAVNNRGDEYIDECNDCHTMQSAQNWAANYMLDRGNTVYAIITATKLISKDGNMIKFKYTREEAMYEKLRGKKGPECKKNPTSSSLSFRPKASGDKSYFSRG